MRFSEFYIFEAKGLFGRNQGDQFYKDSGEVLTLQSVTAFPDFKTSPSYETPEERDQAIESIEKQYGTTIQWVNQPNAGTLAFGVAVLTDETNKVQLWGRYLKATKADMMGAWENKHVPAGWKLKTAGAEKLAIGIDPQNLIGSEREYKSVNEIKKTVSQNTESMDPILAKQLVEAIDSLGSGELPVFEDQIANAPAIRDYFGEIMGPVALMGDIIHGQADDALKLLLGGVHWKNNKVFWPMSANYNLVDSIFIGPDGQEVGISSKGGKGAKASAKNLYDAVENLEKAGNTELLTKFAKAVKIIKLIHNNSALDGPFRMADFLGFGDKALEAEIKKYIETGKKDYRGLSPAAKELLSLYKPNPNVKGFNTGYALLSNLAKKSAEIINTRTKFSQAALAFMNNSSMVQIYTKTGKRGNDVVVNGFDAIYPPNFKGRILIDGGKNYYSTRIGGKFAFGFH